MTRRRRGPFGMSLHEHHVKARRHFRDEHWTVMLHSPHERGRVRPNDGGWQRGERCMRVGTLAKRTTRHLIIGWSAITFDKVVAPWASSRYETLWDVYLWINRN